MKEHNSTPLNDYVEYPPEEMLKRSESFYLDIKRRHSIRQFSDRAVPKAIIENCIKAAGTAPMALTISLGTSLQFIHQKLKNK